ncbi:PucR family transcriptional regulator [Sporolactobacillus pectinivorans]|uniref:PucR family transcriptional regulator n=1 Tax=Sporolactobacillus pectinivorans TaxID=1591408 RepID=UPI000C25856D|nr:PucR family transcriptional regulator [Sporolactobacillus pectinivorans]
MNYTLSHILSHSLMAKAVVLSGQNVLETQPVESVSVIELPVERFVRKNEFVLTTAIGCQDEQIFLSFVKEIRDSGAAALAIAIGGYIHHIPRVVLTFAVENNFPLITLPWEIRFSDVIKSIISGIHQWEQLSQHNVDDLQREMLRFFLDGRSIRDALQAMAAVFGIKVALRQDGTGTVILPTGQAREEYFNPDFLDEAPPTGTGEASKWQKIRKTTFQIFPFQTLNQQNVSLIMTTDRPALLPIPDTTLDQAVTPLNLWFKMEQPHSEKIQEEKAAFLSQLIQGKWDDSKELEMKASSYGIALSDTFIVILGQPESDSSKNQRYLAKPKVEELILVCSSDLERKTFCAFYEELLVIFLETKDDGRKDFILFLDQVTKRLADADFPAFSWGIDDRPGSIPSLPNHFSQAKTALEIGRKYQGPGHRMIYSETAFYRALEALSRNEAANELVQNTLGQLIAYQGEHGLDLLPTLKCYINCKGNVSQAARVLSLQRQSLIYRIQKIEHLSGRSLSDPDDLFVFQLCLKLLND